MATFYVIPKDEDLQHYGILGMKWGVRRYQNSDGSLTAAGQRRYLSKDTKENRAIRTAARSTVGTLVGGPLGGIIGGTSGLLSNQKKINEKHLKEDMMDLEKKHSIKIKMGPKRKDYVTSRSIMDGEKYTESEKLYKQVHKNATDKEIKNAGIDAFEKMKKRENRKAITAAATSVAITSGYILVKSGALDSVLKKAVNNIKENDKNVQYGKAWTQEQAKEYFDVDLNSMNSAGYDEDFYKNN